MDITPKERVRLVLEHREVDRPPLDLGGSFVSAMNVVAYTHLCQAMGMPIRTPLLREQTQSVTLDDEMRQLLGVDTIGLYERSPRPDLDKPSEERSIVSEWGLTYRQADSDGAPYCLVGDPPLAQATTADLESYPWPDPLTPARFAGIAEEIATLRCSPYAVVGNVGWTEIFGLAWYLRGFENLMVDLLTNKDFAASLLRHVTDFQKARFKAFLELAGDVVDVIYFGDDMGGQEGLFLSPRTYREMIKPMHAEVLQVIRSHTRARVLFHSCGAVMPILDDLIEIGMDILNPIQVLAKGMDSLDIKRRYGQHIAFWGAIDTQRVLPFCTPDQVRAYVQRQIADLGSGGGYVVAPTHVIQPDVPPANIIALCRGVGAMGG